MATVGYASVREPQATIQNMGTSRGFFDLLAQVMAATPIEAEDLDGLMNAPRGHDQTSAHYECLIVHGLKPQRHQGCTVACANLGIRGK